MANHQEIDFSKGTCLRTAHVVLNCQGVIVLRRRSRTLCNNATPVTHFCLILDPLDEYILKTQSQRLPHSAPHYSRYL
jgi:hypothetical protein